MPAVESSTTIRESARRASRSVGSAQAEQILASAVRDGEAINEAWASIIDNMLMEWLRLREDFKIEGLQGPTDDAIMKAHEIVDYMRRENWLLPTGVIPNGEGGIAFENKNDPWYQRIEIEEDGSTFLETFRDCQFVERNPINIG